MANSHPCMLDECKSEAEDLTMVRATRHRLRQRLRRSGLPSSLKCVDSYRCGHQLSQMVKENADDDDDDDEDDGDDDDDDDDDEILFCWYRPRSTSSLHACVP